jgi:Family of unknown function (DUF5895)
MICAVFNPIAPHWDSDGLALSPQFTYLLTPMTTSKYLTAAYAATDFSFPYCQALRGEDPKQCGYFVPLSQADKAGWHNLDPDKLTQYAYNSGKTEIGILLKQPRMALTPVCQLGMFDRKASQEDESLVVIGKWDRQHRGENIGNFQIYLVMFFDEQKQPLHDIPLKLVAKGAHQATLSDQWQKFCVSVARCQAKTNRTIFSPRNEAFNALCLFQPLIIRKTVGDKIKSPACYIDGYVAPTIDSWQDFFIGTDEDIADVVIGMMNPRPRLLLADPTPGTIVFAPAPEPLSQLLVPSSPIATPAIDPTPAIDVSSTFADDDEYEFEGLDHDHDPIPF